MAVKSTECMGRFRRRNRKSDAFGENDYKAITKAFGRYVCLLDEAEADKTSDNPRREFYALPKEQCLERAIASAE